VRIRSYSDFGFSLIISRIILFILSRFNIKNVSVIAKSNSIKKIVIFIMRRADQNSTVKKRVQEKYLKILIKEYQRG
jgi:multisubunit Na+/H+ antiporter MnhE subunit